MGFALAMVLPMGGAAMAGTKVEGALRNLDPASRLEQVCNLEAMQKIGRDNSTFRPERAVVDAVSRSKIKDNTIQGSGAAFRSRGKWYQFTFKCSTTPDRMKVLSFDYRIGAVIPPEKWSAYGLYQ